eukprot:Clim_evm64s191 gene=Clim_evmTU64s191
MGGLLTWNPHNNPERFTYNEKIMMTGLRVVLAKEPSLNGNDHDPYVQAFQKQDATIEYVPILKHNTASESEIRKKLSDQHASEYLGIALTSTKAVRAIQQAFPVESTPLSSSWTELPYFVVGAKTGAAAKDLFRGREAALTADNATTLGKELLTWIDDKRSKGSEFDGKKVLFPCSAIALENLQAMLAKGETGIQLDRWHVYSTGPDLQGASKIREALESGKTDAVVFFSPSGVSAVLGTNPSPSPARAAFGAMGPSTEQTLRDSGHVASFVAAHPTPEDLAEAFGAWKDSLTTKTTWKVIN